MLIRIDREAQNEPILDEQKTPILFYFITKTHFLFVCLLKWDQMKSCILNCAYHILFRLKIVILY